jgi:hypothetical protein
MPRLGVSEGDGGNSNRAPLAHAYHHPSTRRANLLWTLLSILLSTLMLRNLFFKVITNKGSRILLYLQNYTLASSCVHIFNYVCLCTCRFAVGVKDYRQEEIARLKAAGKTDAEIDILFPKPKSERVKAARDDYMSLKLDVLQLKKDVQMLRSKIVVLEQNINGTEVKDSSGPSIKGESKGEEKQ